MSKYVYGVVFSRRLGRSLGVNIVPFKTCSYDCIYCQFGRTTNKTLKREEFFPPSEVLSEVMDALSMMDAEYVTFSGFGEPTLNASLGWLIRQIKEEISVPVAVITNGSLLFDEEVRWELSAADVVMPTLCTTDPQIFACINRPHSQLQLDTIIQGMINFRKRFSGNLWLELFFVGNVNTSQENLLGLRAVVNKINADCIHINTVLRPPVEISATPVDRALLQNIAEFLGATAKIISLGCSKKGGDLF